MNVKKLLKGLKQHTKDFVPVKPRTKVFVSNAESFTALLPYDSYDEEHGVFINKSTIGFGVEVHGYLGSANPEAVKRLMTYVQKILPEGNEYFLQVIRFTNHEMYERLNANEAASSVAGGSYAEFAKMGKKYQITLAKNGMMTKAGIPLSLYDTRVFLFVSLKYKRSADNRDLKMQLAKLEARKKEALSDTSMRALNIQEFLSLLQSMVNPYPERVKTPKSQYNPLMPISDQICKSDYHIDQRFEGLDVGFYESPVHYPNKVQTEVVSMGIDSYPSNIKLWNIPEAFASLRNESLVLTCPHIFTFTMQFRAYESVKQEVARQISAKDRFVKTPSATMLIPTLRDEYQELIKLQDLMKSGDIKITKADVHASLLLFTHESTRRRDIKSAVDAFTTAGFQIGVKDGAHLFQYMAALPMTPGEGYFDDAKALSMRQVVTNFNAVNLMPILHDWKGSYTGLMIPTPRNQMACFSPFDPRFDNSNICVGAGSGSGKSFLMQAMIRQVLSNNGRVWIFDRGNSYKKSCEMLGGIYINSDNLKLNPFTFLPTDPKDLEMALVAVRDLIGTMISPNQGVDSYIEGIIHQAVNTVYEEKGNGATIDDVVEYFKQVAEVKQDLRISDLVTILYKYTKGQVYGKYFSEGSQLDPNAKLIAIELGDFDSVPDLQRILLCALIMHVSEEMYHTGRSVQKLCVIDEAWAFLDGSNPTTARFIECGFRTSRKHGGGFVVITQDYDSFYDNNNRLAMAVFGCSEIKIIMRQNNDRFRQFCQKNENTFSAYEQKVIENFQPAKMAGFSSFCIKTNAFISFHRLIVDPLSRVMFSTEPKEYQAVEDLIKQGHSTFEAVYRVANAFYPDEMKQFMGSPA